MISDPNSRSIVALTGFMGSGKSSVGKALAALTGWNFVDLDREIEISQQQEIRDLFRQHGEERFRDLENEILRAVLAERQRPMVLATGGGAFVQPRNAALLTENGATVVFLHVDAEILLQRCCLENEENDGTRPLVRDRESFLRLYEQRLPFYCTAELVFDSNRKTPEAIAREIVIRLGMATL